MFKTWYAAGAAALLFALAASPANADTIPYPNAGTENPDTYTFTAITNGNIVAYFYSADADYTEEIGLEINGVPTGVFGLDNHASATGNSVTLGHAQAGDVLTFVDRVISGPAVVPFDWYSDPSLNSESAQHVYSTFFSGSGLIPAGTYIGFEDLPGGDTDWDYNDMQFVFTDVSDIVTGPPGGGLALPEAPVWALMLLGFVGLELAGRRRFAEGFVPGGVGARRFQTLPAAVAALSGRGQPLARWRSL